MRRAGRLGHRGLRGLGRLELRALHAGQSVFRGDDEDEGIVVKAVKVPFTGLKYAGKGAWWLTKEVGKGTGKGIASLFSGDELGLPIQRRGGHTEIVGPVSNREFMRERGHMGGFFEQTKERFPARMGLLGPRPPRATRFCFRGARVWKDAHGPFIHGAAGPIRLNRAGWQAAKRAGRC